MSVCRLFTGRSGQAYFGTKRFDRMKGKRVHMYTASGLMHDNFRMSTMDYGHLMDCAFQMEKHVNAYEKVLRLAAFNVFAHNVITSYSIHYTKLYEYYFLHNSQTIQCNL